MNKKLETLKELFCLLNVNDIHYAVTGTGWFASKCGHGANALLDKLTILVMPSGFLQAIALLEGRNVDDPFVHLIRADVDSWYTVTRSKTINFDGIEVEIIQEVNRLGLFFLHEVVPGFFTTDTSPIDGGKYLRPLDQLLWMAGEQTPNDAATTLMPFMQELLQQIERDPFQANTFIQIRQNHLPQFTNFNHVIDKYEAQRNNV